MFYGINLQLRAPNDLHRCHNLLHYSELTIISIYHNIVHNIRK